MDVQRRGFHRVEIQRRKEYLDSGAEVSE
jgi:hypothetical protein